MNPYIGHESQIRGVEEYRTIGGRSDGMRFYRVRNGLGLEMTISIDRCLDIASLTFDGCNMSYTSVGGQVAPAYYTEDQDGFGFLKSFNCGFLTTCGLHNIGTPGVDEKPYGLHGTIGNLPASHSYYTMDEDYIYIHGLVSDEIIFGKKATLERTISVSLKKNTFTYADRVTNTGSVEEEIMLLYHMNMGYPLLSEDTTLAINSQNVIPRDERAAEDTDTWNQFLTPTPNFEEQCYYHTFQEDKAVVEVKNPKISKGLTIKFDTKYFPQMTEWKMMGERDYVLGLEPCTNTLEGRSIVRENGQLQMLRPKESKDFKVEITLNRL